MNYPEARIENTTDTLAGVTLPDPYRWLEANTEEVRRWQRAQGQLASAHVREWPAFEALQDLVERYNVERLDRGAGMPRFAGGLWFRTVVAPGESQQKVVASESHSLPGEVLFDPGSESGQSSAYVSWISPSPDGRTLAVGVCGDGSENNRITLVDVGTRAALPGPPPQVLMDNWTGGAHWLRDSTGFFFTALVGSATDFEQRVYFHRRLPVVQTAAVEIPWITSREFRMVIVSRDGSYAVALERLTKAVPVAIARLDKPELRWEPFVTDVDGSLAGHVIGDHYVAVTNVGAPRGRLVAIPLEAENPNDPEQWEEVVKESDAVLRTVTPVADLLYLSEYLDTYSRVRVVTRNGEEVQTVPLPDRGAVGELSFPLQTMAPRGHPDLYLFVFSSLTVSQGIYCHQPGRQAIETLQAPKVRLENAVVEDRYAISKDGTRVPFHIVRRSDAAADMPAATLISAYGGFNAPLTPQFPGSLAAFVAAGGLYVHAHLRGGGELGLAWWEGGRMRNKQNGYDDLYAVAENLIDTRRCTPQRLALMGGSNGGLMAGVALTQRPELWRVVIPRVPMLDLIGACRDAYGRMCIAMEYADVDDPEEVRRLSTFSPYHLIRRGVRYPAVFLDAGNTDPRCPAWHARKFAARLQHTSADGDMPVLLHVWENVGHGWATDKSVMNAEHTEWLAFALRHLGVESIPAV